MLTSSKRWVLISAAVALVAIVFLAAGLSNLELQPGQNIRLLPERSRFAPNLLDQLVGPNLRAIALLILYIAGYVLLPLSIILFIFKPEMRKGFLRYLGPLIWLLALYYIIFNLPKQLDLDEFTPPNAEFTEDAFGQAAGSMLGNAPEWLVYLVTFLVLILVVAAGLYIYLRFFRRTPLQEIAQEAQEALDDLYAGADLSDTIKRCYVDMSRALTVERGIQRSQAMTPREFEQRLGSIGLPLEQVQQLTRLFEQVRYGDKQANQQQEQQAIDCLSAIVLYAHAGT